MRDDDPEVQLRLNATVALLGAQRVLGVQYADPMAAVMMLRATIDPPLADLPARAWRKVKRP